MELSLRDRLKRLGVHKGPGALKPLVPAGEATSIARPASTSSAILWNVEAPTIFGPALIARTVFATGHVHGDQRIGDAAAHAFRDVHPRQALYLDTETTGLAGGSGTLAFLVGVGYLQADDFVVDQYFLRNPAAELAMLAHLDSRISRHGALVTFNGKAFDIPLLETRFAMQRVAPQFRDKQHLDLLQPARQMWRGSLVDCRLGTLEHHLLGVHRTQEDIAGFLVPQIYREYLQAGAPEMHDEMRRVMYHNLHDIVSMLTLAAHLRQSFDQPSSAREHAAVAAVAERSGDYASAVTGYRRAIDAELAVSLQPSAHGRRTRAKLAASLKKLDRSHEAVEHWQMMAVEGDLAALTELAKHYEWKARDFASALKCAQRGLQLAADPITRAEFAARVARLGQKVAAGGASSP